MTKNVLWQELYTSAMLELDHACLQKKIQAAQAAILQAREELGSNRQGGVEEDAQAMADALRNLQTLQRVELRPFAQASGRGECLAEG